MNTSSGILFVARNGAFPQANAVSYDDHDYYNGDLPQNKRGYGGCSKGRCEYEHLANGIYWKDYVPKPDVNISFLILL